MYQSIMVKIKKCTSEDWVVVETIVKHSIKVVQENRDHK